MSVGDGGSTRGWMIKAKLTQANIIRSFLTRPPHTKLGYSDVRGKRVGKAVSGVDLAVEGKEERGMMRVRRVTDGIEEREFDNVVGKNINHSKSRRGE